MENSNMVFCRGCAKEIHSSAPACPHCGALQNPFANQHHREPRGTLWLPVPSLICGVIVLLGALDDSDWSRDELMGALILGVIATVLGTAGLVAQEKGRGMSVAGLVLGISGLLIALSKSFD